MCPLTPSTHHKSLSEPQPISMPVRPPNIKTVDATAAVVGAMRLHGAGPGAGFTIFQLVGGAANS